MEGEEVEEQAEDRQEAALEVALNYWEPNLEASQETDWMLTAS